MKQHNINAVRTSHYPNDAGVVRPVRRVRPLPDRRGQHRVARHGLQRPTARWATTPSGRPPTWTARCAWSSATRTTRRSSSGRWATRPATASTSRPPSAWIKQRDPSRPVQYEQAGLQAAHRHRTCRCTRRRAAIAEYASKPQTRPLILCEYAHAMGNSTGNFREYWDLFYSKPQLQGGFDLGLGRPGHPHAHPAGRRAPGSPGAATAARPGVPGRVPPRRQGAARTSPSAATSARLDVPSDFNFCMNGLVNADRAPHPGLLVVKKNYQYVQVKPVDLATRRDRDHQLARLHDAGRGAAGRWKVQADGVTVAGGAIPPLSAGPARARRRSRCRLPRHRAETGRRVLARPVVHG